MIEPTMMNVPLSLNHLLERAGTLFARNTIVSRLPDKSLRTHSYRDYHRRTRALAAALQGLGLQPGERVATLCWNHHAHLECYFGIPAAGGVMHTLNLRLAPDEIGWIAGNAEDRFLVVDDILLPLYRQFAHLHAFERVIVFPFSGAAVDAGVPRLRGPARRRRPRPLRIRAARREHADLDVLHVGHHRAAEGRRLFAPLDGAAHPGRLPRRFLGFERHRRAVAGDADVPRQLLGHPVRRGDDGREARVPRPAPAPRGPARPDAARAADLVARRADDLDGADPGLRAGRGDAAGALEAAGRAALDGRRGRGARGADPRVREARRRDRAGLGHDRDLAARDRLLRPRRTAGRLRRRALPPRRAGRCAGAAGRTARARRGRQ